jgi:hypothetical protein
LYIAVSTSSTTPSAASIKAGVGFAFASSQGITTSGVKTFNATGLSSVTTYHHYYVHTNVNGDSNVLSGSSFTTQASGGVLLLDTISSVVRGAYSLRKLRTAYTGFAIRVRRSSDNTEQDIGFSSNVLDDVALLAFVGSGDGFIAVWYDQQSGAPLNLSQASTAAQPKIVVNGVVVTSNSKPCMDMLTSAKLTTTSSFTWGNSVCMIAVASTGATGYRRLVNVGTDNNCFFGAVNSNNAVFVGAGGWNDVAANTPSITVTQQSVMSFINLSSVITPYINGTAQNTKNGSTSSITTQLGLASYGGQEWAGIVSELIVFSNLSTTERRSIEVNQGVYYGVTV